MHSSFSRLNAVTALATTVILVLVVLVDFSSYNTSKAVMNNPIVVNELRVVRGKAAWHMDRNIQDFAEVSFDIDADFTSLFNWNTKQIFVSIAAEYGTNKIVKNEVVIWDRILRSKQDAHISLQAASNKYGLREVSRSFRYVENATFVLKYNIMPKVGLLHYADQYTTASIPIPPIPLLENGQKPKAQRVYY